MRGGREVCYNSVMNLESKHKVLVVEDDNFLRKILAEKLQEKNFEVIEAERGEQGVEALKSSPDVSIVLLDLLLPGLSGYDFIKWARGSGNFHTIPILVISNLGSPEEIAMAKQCGADDSVIKAHMTPDDIVLKVIGMIKTPV